jgi:hypothetical protein
LKPQWFKTIGFHQTFKTTEHLVEQTTLPCSISAASTGLSIETVNEAPRVDHAALSQASASPVALADALGPLLPQHLADLRKSGLSDETIARGGFFSVSDPTTVARILRWKGPKGIENAAALGPCLLITFRSVDGRLLNPFDYARLKPDRPRIDREKGKPIKYESPIGMRNRAYLFAGVHDVLKDPSVRIAITEGEKKAAKAMQEGIPCIGLVGVWGFQRKRNRNAKGRPYGDRQLIGDLAQISWNGRRVIIVYDSDAAENEQVLRAEFALGETLGRHGAKVFSVRLAAGKNGEKVGLDDFLLSNGAVEFWKLAEAAVPRHVAYQSIAPIVPNDLFGSSPEAVARNLAVLQKDREEEESRRQAEREQREKWDQLRRVDAALLAGLEELPRKRYCGLIRNCVSKEPVYVEELDQRQHIILSLKTRCRSWRCAFCARLNMIQWQLLTTSQIASLKTVWIGSGRSNEWTNNGACRQRYVDRSKRAGMPGNCRIVAQRDGSVAVITDSTLEGAMEFTGEQAVEKLKWIFRQIATDVARPVAGSRAWKLPKRKKSGKFKILATSGSDLNGTASILEASGARIIRSGGPLDGDDEYGGVLGHLASTLPSVPPTVLAKCLSFGEPPPPGVPFAQWAKFVGATPDDVGPRDDTTQSSSKFTIDLDAIARTGPLPADGPTFVAV